MALSVGDHLGRFEVLGAVGAGGMGEVYRARDPHLEREVAIKVLPAAFFDDADRRRRFEQEARAAGGLNHPNILSVFDVGIEGASSYIVTELLAGETLRERMGDRPVPPRKAADYALQISSGLAAAHDHGVVHRDIKPENLFVTTDGRIKILDFGLAKLAGPGADGITEAVSIDEVQHTPIMGTATYMSPEQARGLRVDHRTDIFSFGVVLYEMLAGYPPFRRATTHDTLSAILHDEPTKLPAVDDEIPALEQIVRHCLEKKPDERYQNFRDLAFQLQTRSQDTGAARAAGRRTLSRRAVRWGGGLVALLAAAVTGALVASQLLVSPPSTAAHRVRPMTNLVGLEEFPSISPDGNMVAYTAAQAGRRQVFVRFVTGGSGSPLPVTNDDVDHQLPRWSADGSSLVYFSPAAPGALQGTINRIPALGGPAQRVIDSIGGGDVSNGGRLACFRLDKERMQLITSTLEGSDIRIITELTTRHHAYPRWSPDNKWIAFQAGDGLRWDVYKVDARGGQPIQLTNERRIVRGLTWLPDSTGIIYASARGSTLPYLPPLALWEVDADGKQPPRQRTPPEASYEQPDLHRSGLLAVTRQQMRFSIWKYAFDETAGPGRGEQLMQHTGYLGTPTAAPYGDEIAYLSDNGGHANVWVASLASAQSLPRRITAEDDPNVSVGAAIWSPDGKWIAVVSSKGNVGFDFGIGIVRPDGSEFQQIIPKGLGPAWSDDGKWLYYVETASTPIKRIAVPAGKPENVRPQPARSVIGVYGSTVYFVVERALVDGRPEFDLQAAPLGDGPARSIRTIPASRVPTSWQVVNPSLSPDGKWMAVPLTDGFTTNIWAISTEDGRLKQITNFGDRTIFIARRVSWSPDGRSIFAAIAEGDADVVVLDGLIKGIARVQ